MQRFIRILAAIALALSSAGALARLTDADMLGSSAQSSAAQRTVVIGPRTRWVAVEQGEIVRFVSGGQEFAWAFSGLSSTIDLGRIAPTGTLDRALTVYVWPNANEER